MSSQAEDLTGARFGCEAIAMWALGLVTAIGGAFIHLLLILAVVVLAAQLLTGRRVA
jgi:Family of unknown function (DUF5670)